MQANKQIQFDSAERKAGGAGKRGGMGRVLGLAAQTFLLAGMIAVAPDARAQSTMPDSQVEANVLKALAGAPDLATQAISTNTVYGVVTLSGTVQDDALRVKAENLAANATGVKKVIDELQVGNGAAAAGAQGASPAGQNSAGNANGGQGSTTPGPGMVLQSDGTYAPASSADASGALPDGGQAPAPGSAPASGAVMNDPDHDQAQYAQQGTAGNGAAPGGQAPAGQVQSGQGQPNPPYGANGAQGYPQQQANGYPQQQPYGYPPQQANGAANYPQGRAPAYNQPYAQNGRAPWGGQVGGEVVTVPAGTLVRVRVNRLLASNRVKAGDHFDGFIANDVTAGGQVALPRGAAVQGVVVDAKASGAISGRGELSIQLTSVTLGGRQYPIVSDVWAHDGADKTIQTINSAAGFGVAGALIGAIAGRGAGAAIGAGVGAAAGVGASAASPRGQVVIPPEGMVSFNLAQPATVTTVSEQEMQRLAYGLPPGQGQRRPMYPRPYPGYYPGYPPPPPYGYPAY